MVYCTKCGTQNADDARVCVNCGSPLYGAAPENRPAWGYRHYDYEYRGYHRRSGAIATAIIGLILVLVGFSFLVSEVTGVSIPWFPLIIILLGIFILIRIAWVRGRKN